LYENTPFHFSKISHASRNNYQINLTSMEIKETHRTTVKTLKVDDDTMMLIKNKITPLNNPYPNCMKTLYFIVLISLMVTEIII